jgi:hypothetical protein
MNAVLETCLWHGSDWIAWIDRSGDARPGVLPLVDIPLEVKLTGRPPRDLSVVHKPGRTLLWRLQPETLRRTEPGEVDAAGRQRPAVPPYALEGELSDPSGKYLPRRFALNVGTAVGHSVPVYRAPVNVRYQSAGGLQGRAVFADGTPAAWAVIEVTVTPPLAGAMPFVTQADARGEFRLALNRLPALTKDAPASRYDATVAVRASLAAAGAASINPDLLPAVQVNALANLKITPGRVDRLHSAGSDKLVLQPLPAIPPAPPIPPGP